MRRLTLRRKTPTASWAGLTALTVALSAACSGSTPRSPERSVAEYDVAVDLFRERQQPRQALERAFKALEFDQENAEAHHLVSLIYLFLCDQNSDDCRLAEAEAAARKAVELDEKLLGAKNTLAVVLVHRHEYAKAIAVLKPLTEDILYTTPELAWGNLGWAYLEAGSYDAAIEALQRSIAAQPAFCVGNYRLGVAYSKKGDAKAALVALDRALDTANPRCRGIQEAFVERAVVKTKLEQVDAAAEDLRACIRLDKETDTGRQCSALLAELE